MTCKRALDSHGLSVFASVVAVFILVVGLGTPGAIASTPLFLPAVTYGSGGSYPVSVAVADVNDDGKPDLLVANSQSSTVSVLLGNGDGTFQTAVSYSPGGSDPTSLVAGDVNGDGKLDLVVTNASNTVGVLLGHGDGTFPPAVTYDSGGYFPNSVAIA